MHPNYYHEEKVVGQKLDKNDEDYNKHEGVENDLCFSPQIIVQ